MRPLNDRAEAELDNWVRGQSIAAAVASLGPEATKAEKDAAFDRALQKAGLTTWDNDRGAAYINCVRGWAQVVWQSIRRDQPEITPGELAVDFKEDPEGLGEAVKVFLELNHRGRSSREEGHEKNAQRRERRRRHRKRNKNRTWDRSTEPWQNGTAGGRTSSRN
jgi:hypothetical protein